MAAGERHAFADRKGFPAAHYVYNVLLFQYYVIYPLALAGALLMLRARRRLHELRELVASYALAHALVSPGNFRLAAPLYLVLCLLAGHAITQLGAWWRSRQPSGVRAGAPADPAAEARLAYRSA